MVSNMLQSLGVIILAKAKKLAKDINYTITTPLDKVTTSKQQSSGILTGSVDPSREINSSIIKMISKPN
ncbi:hypothetical protein [Nostoc sp. 2RC]|uniref:hypothetical protein n=1 Tax=Nostoc sp. 2RC TaxID=2485484 RepID=UPI0016236B35|nr:hypothetical protein [Nostoc sp. 2RC]MBC1238964.1 hypothetical protein [Nostoc sp. 2RC]